MANATAAIPLGSAVGTVFFGLIHLFVQQPNAVALGYTAFTLAEIIPHMLWNYNTAAPRAKDSTASTRAFGHPTLSVPLADMAVRELVSEATTGLINEIVDNIPYDSTHYAAAETQSKSVSVSASAVPIIIEQSTKNGDESMWHEDAVKKTITSIETAGPSVLQRVLVFFTHRFSNAEVTFTTTSQTSSELPVASMVRTDKYLTSSGLSGTSGSFNEYSVPSTTPEYDVLHRNIAFVSHQTPDAEDISIATFQTSFSLPDASMVRIDAHMTCSGATEGSTGVPQSVTQSRHFANEHHKISYTGNYVIIVFCFIFPAFLLLSPYLWALVARSCNLIWPWLTGRHLAIIGAYWCYIAFLVQELMEHLSLSDLWSKVVFFADHAFNQFHKSCTCIWSCITNYCESPALILLSPSRTWAYFRHYTQRIGENLTADYGLLFTIEVWWELLIDTTAKCIHTALDFLGNVVASSRCVTNITAKVRDMMFEDCPDSLRHDFNANWRPIAWSWTWRGPTIVLLTTFSMISFLHAFRASRNILVQFSVVLVYVLAFIAFLVGPECTQDVIVTVATAFTLLLFCDYGLHSTRALIAIANGLNSISRASSSTKAMAARLYVRVTDSVLYQLIFLPHRLSIYEVSTSGASNLESNMALGILEANRDIHIEVRPSNEVKANPQAQSIEAIRHILEPEHQLRAAAEKTKRRLTELRFRNFPADKKKRLENEGQQSVTKQSLSAIENVSTPKSAATLTGKLNNLFPLQLTVLDAETTAKQKKFDENEAGRRNYYSRQISESERKCKQTLQNVELEQEIGKLEQEISELEQHVDNVQFVASAKCDSLAQSDTNKGKASKKPDMVTNFASNTVDEPKPYIYEPEKDPPSTSPSPGPDFGGNLSKIAFTTFRRRISLNHSDSPLPDLYRRNVLGRPRSRMDSKEGWRDRLLGGESILTQMRRKPEAAQDNGPNTSSKGSGGLPNPPPLDTPKDGAASEGDDGKKGDENGDVLSPSPFCSLSGPPNGGEKDDDNDSSKPTGNGEPPVKTEASLSVATYPIVTNTDMDIDDEDIEMNDAEKENESIAVNAALNDPAAVGTSDETGIESGDDPTQAAFLHPLPTQAVFDTGGDVDIGGEPSSTPVVNADPIQGQQASAAQTSYFTVQSGISNSTLPPLDHFIQFGFPIVQPDEVVPPLPDLPPTQKPLPPLDFQALLASIRLPVALARSGNVPTSVAQPSPIALQRTHSQVLLSINCSPEASVDAVRGEILNVTEPMSVQGSSIALKPQYSEGAEAYHHNPTNDHHGVTDENESSAQVSGPASAQHLSWQLHIQERLDSANTTSLPWIENAAQPLAGLANNKVSDSRDAGDVAPEHPRLPSDSDQLFENVLVSEDMNINPKDANIIEGQDSGNESDPSELGADEGAEMIVEAMKSKNKIERENDEFEADDEEKNVDKPVFLSEKQKKGLNRRTKKPKRRNPTLIALTSSP